MFRRVILPLIFGVVGAGILVGLGVWQVQRLQWKEAILSDIDARIAATPVALPVAPSPEVDRYRPVIVTGEFTGEGIDVLVSRKQVGPGIRAIEVFLTDTGRRILIDRGFLPEDQRTLPRDTTVTEVTGNLHWPVETDSYTPPPDARTGLWFARDLPALAATLKADPVLVVARSDTGSGIVPMPVDTSDIPNDHLGYAVTWFSLAVVWLGMTGLLLWRNRRRTV